MEILKDVGFVTAIITIFFSILSSYLTLMIKNKHDNQVKYNEIAEKKLMEIVNRLIYDISVSELSMKKFYLSNFQTELIREKGHLLPTQIYNDLLNAIVLENNLKDEEESNLALSNEYFTYKKLIKRILENLKVEQTELSNIQNKKFNYYKRNINSDIYKRIGDYIKSVSKVVLNIVIVTGLFIYIISDSIDSSQFANTEEYIKNLFIILIIVIIVGFAYIGLCSFVFGIVSPIIDFFYLRKGLYKSDYIVSKEGNYKCRICNNEIRYIKGDRLEYCNHNGVKKNFKNDFVIHYWHYQKENS